MSGQPTRVHRVALIRGDGIGPELVEAALVVLDAVQQRLGGFQCAFREFEGGAAAYRKYGHNLSREALEAIAESDALMKAPTGLPDVRLPDGTEAGSLGGVLRPGLNAYANVRPIRLLPAIDAPLKGASSGIDYVIVRENMEGLYLSRGRGIGNDTAMSDILMVTRPGTERVCRYAFELARSRNGARKVTCVDKSNVLASYAFFRQIFDEVGGAYPDIEREYLYADAAAQALVMRPQSFDVLVMENFIGDVLSDLGGATVGGIGLCPSANMGDGHAYFEPIHGSAPDIAGEDRANPISQVLTLAMMLDYLGEQPASAAVRSAVESALESGALRVAPNGQPEHGTRAAAQAIADAVNA